MVKFSVSVSVLLIVYHMMTCLLAADFNFSNEANIELDSVEHYQDLFYLIIYFFLLSLYNDNHVFLMMFAVCFVFISKLYAVAHNEERSSPGRVWAAINQRWAALLSGVIAPDSSWNDLLFIGDHISRHPCCLTHFIYMSNILPPMQGTDINQGLLRKKSNQPGSLSTA